MRVRCEFCVDAAVGQFDEEGDLIEFINEHLVERAKREDDRDHL